MAAALLGAALTVGIGARAQAAPGYVVNEIEVTDETVFQTYRTQQSALIRSFDGRFLARGSTTETIAGAPAASRVVIYVFDSMEKLRAWRNAPEQTALNAIRDRSSKFRSFAVEGEPQ